MPMNAEEKPVLYKERLSYEEQITIYVKVQKSIILDGT